ncbi:Phosphoribosyl isomerase A [bacterium HR39]|nr:Phosphoribosyl isomerase A [bacterium HR39]
MPFAVIPVLDLRGGQVVRAVAGKRAAYRPLGPGDSVLVETAEPLAVARAFRGLFPFGVLYVADLDAIEGRGDQLAVIRALASALPDVELWVDAGIADAAALEALLAVPRTVAVLGSESQRDAGLVRAVRDEPRVVLSLDWRGEKPQGPAELFHDPALWPARVIVMTLARVGTGGGPDVARLRDVLARAGGREVYAAGGVRDPADLGALRDLGCAGALVATALHRGVIGRGDLERLVAP